MYRGRGQSVKSDNYDNLQYHSSEQGTSLHGPLYVAGVPYHATYNHIIYTQNTKHMQHCVLRPPNLLTLTFLVSTMLQYVCARPTRKVTDRRSTTRLITKSFSLPGVAGQRYKHNHCVAQRAWTSKGSEWTLYPTLLCYPRQNSHFHGHHSQHSYFQHIITKPETQKTTPVQQQHYHSGALIT